MKFKEEASRLEDSMLIGNDSGQDNSSNLRKDVKRVTEEILPQELLADTQASPKLELAQIEEQESENQLSHR